MSKSNEPEEWSRFSGHFRHYHRSASKNPKSWDEWVEGKPPVIRDHTKWARALAFAVAALLLAAVATSLIIELH